jgi:cellulose synthase/poly-beta-1,6-N-acetylglucosamine synthase-like glycosyltransferase
VQAQDPHPAEIVVVHRPEDDATAAFLDRWRTGDPGRRIAVEVTRPGIVPALMAGTDAARSEVVVYTDDDAVPHPGWLAGLLRPFDDPSVGAVGGRIVDHVDGHAVTGRARRVGHVTWYGRIIWNHTLEAEYAGSVDFVVGASLAVRQPLARFDPRLLHTYNGHAMGNDIDLCLGVWRAGLRVVYRPDTKIDHFTTSFRDPELASRVSGEGVTVSAANHTYVVLKHSSLFRRFSLRVYGYLIGSATTPGPFRVVIEAFRRPGRARAMAGRVRFAWKGRRAAARLYRAERRGEPVTTVAPEPAAAGRRSG